jgi:hypothetical protein
MNKVLCCCRFFLKNCEFENEAELYRNPVLRKVLPQLLGADDNASGKERSRRCGYPWQSDRYVFSLNLNDVCAASFESLD